MREISKHERDLVVLIAIISILILLLLIGGRMFYYAKDVGYKEACEDFYKGKLKYDLISNQDGSIKEWRRVK